VFSLFIPIGCERDLPDDGPVPDRMVTVNFTVGSLLKSAASDEENEIIGNIILFSVVGGDVVQKFILSPEGGSLSIPGTVTMLYAIANPSDALTTALDTELPVPVTTLLDPLTADFPPAPASPFLMSGKANVVDNSVNITLARCVAKIQLTSTNPDFLIESVTVSAASKGYVFDNSPSVPALTPVNHTYAGSDTVVFYVAEHSSANPPTFTVSGRFQGQPAHLLWVKEQITLKDDGGVNNIEIKRNTCYQVDIDFFDEPL
jgi:hypothetical protein